jgi:hypothetical protein
MAACLGNNIRHGHTQSWRTKPGTHLHGLADAGRLNDAVVKAPRRRQARHFHRQVFSQCAADAAVCELHQALLHLDQGAAPHQAGVNVDLSHVVHDHRAAQALLVAQDVLQQRGLARPQEAAEDGAGQLGSGARRQAAGALAVPCHWRPLFNVNATALLATLGEP